MAKNLCQNLKKLRQAHGLSQETLAQLAGLKLSNLAKLESGANCNPTLSTLTALAQALTHGSLDKLFK